MQHIISVRTIDFEEKTMLVVMSSSSDVHVGHSGFIVGKCPMTKAYLQL